MMTLRSGMHLSALIWLVAVVFVGSVKTQWWHSRSSCPTEASAYDCSESNIYPIADFNTNEVFLGDAVLERLNMSNEKIIGMAETGSTAVDGDLQDYITKSNQCPVEVINKKPYVDTCPSKWIRLPGLKYYVRIRNQRSSEWAYLFPYADTWIVDCPLKYCQIYSKRTPFAAKYLCEKEYMLIWTWVMKVEIEREPFEGQWEFIKVLFPLRLPRCCSCRRYSPWPDKGRKV